jgi:Mn2+/Fe2+ NRAMP family transporter
MDKVDNLTTGPAQAKKALNYVMVALGIVLLVMGIPVLFATSEVSKIVGSSLGQGAVLAILGCVVVVSGATLVAVGLRRR